jgi:hypothetical protein
MIPEYRVEGRNLEEISCRTCYTECLLYPKEFNEQLIGPTTEELGAYRSDKLGLRFQTLVEWSH